MEAIGMQQKPAIIFDFGGVLLKWEPRQLFRELFAGDEAGMEQFLTEINFSAWNLEFDRGLPFAQGVKELTLRFPEYAEPIKAFDERWEETILGPIQGVVEILYQLKAMGYALYGLTNWSSEKFELVRHKYEFFRLFESIVVSGEIHLVKPDERIYAVMLEQIKRSPRQCVFIDDSLNNILTAQTMGFIAIHYQSPEQLLNELESIGIAKRAD
jgi:2-haloacid dehalogenase